jgi:ferredoxin-NADP reductase
LNRFLWLAGGISITPFLFMIGAVIKAKAIDGTYDIILVVSTRESSVIVDLVRAATGVPLPKHLCFQFIIFDTSDTEMQKDSTVKYRRGRVTAKALKALDLDVQDRGTFICRPQPFKKAALEGLGEIGVDLAKVHKESFSY